MPHGQCVRLIFCLGARGLADRVASVRRLQEDYTVTTVGSTAMRVVRLHKDRAGHLTMG